MEPISDWSSMTDSVWRESFDGCASPYANEAFTTDSVREAECLVEELGVAPWPRSLLTALHGLPMTHAARLDGSEHGAFDSATLTEACDMERQTEDEPRSLPLRKCGYVPSELALLWGAAGFPIAYVWGGAAGVRGRRPIEFDELEIMVVIRRPPA